MELNRKNLTIGLAVFIGIVILMSVLVLTGALNLSKLKKFFSKEKIIIEPDAHLMSSRNAYDIALLKAREWKPDATLARISSLVDETGPSGRSDNWDLLFVSKSLKGRGYRIIIRNREISLTEEIIFIGSGGELPENIISSKEAISRIRQAKGYEDAKIVSVEVIYGLDGSQWYWGIKTSKGAARINARQ